MLKHWRPDILARGHVSLLHRPFIPANNYTALFSSILGILSPFSFWKLINETYWTQQFFIFCSNFSPPDYIPPCFHANPPDFPHLIKPRALTRLSRTFVRGSHHRAEYFDVLCSWCYNGDTVRELFDVLCSWCYNGDTMRELFDVLCSWCYNGDTVRELFDVLCSWCYNGDTVRELFDVLCSWCYNGDTVRELFLTVPPVLIMSFIRRAGNTWPILPGCKWHSSIGLHHCIHFISRSL